VRKCRIIDFYNKENAHRREMTLMGVEVLRNIIFTNYSLPYMVEHNNF